MEVQPHSFLTSALDGYIFDMHWPLNLEERAHRCLLNRMPIGHQGLSGHRG